MKYLLIVIALSLTIAAPICKRVRLPGCFGPNCPAKLVCRSPWYQPRCQVRPCWQAPCPCLPVPTTR